MKRKKMAFFVIASLFFWATAAVAYGADTEFTLKFQSSYSTGSKTWPVAVDFADKLEELSGGRIKINRYPSAQLVSTKEALTALRHGAIDILLSAGAYYGGFVPCADVFFVPGIFKGEESVYNLYNNTSFGKILKDAYLKFGVVHVAPILEVAEIFMMREGKALKTLADLNGLLIRGPGGVANKLVKKLGGKPVQIPTGELYTAIQRGTVDGMIYPTYLLVDLKFYEVTKSVLLNPPFIDPLVIDIYMSKKTYDKLPEDLRKCVQQAGLFIQKRGPEIFRKADAKTKEIIKEKGIETYSWSDSDCQKVKEKAVEVLDEWAKKSPDNAALAKIMKENM